MRPTMPCGMVLSSDPILMSDLSNLVLLIDSLVNSFLVKDLGRSGSTLFRRSLLSGPYQFEIKGVRRDTQEGQMHY